MIVPLEGDSGTILIVYVRLKRTCYHDVVQHVSIYQAPVSSSGKIYAPPIWWKRFNNIPMGWILHKSQDQTLLKSGKAVCFMYFNNCLQTGLAT